MLLILAPFRSERSAPVHWRKSISLSLSTVSARRTATGFTLLELLVVIGIITLLSAMLFPSIQKARARAKTAVCANNLKQLGAVFHLYSGDNNDWLPHISQNQWGCPFVGEWFMFYQSYLPVGELPAGPRNIYRLGKAKPVFDCPATDSGEATANADGAICFCGPNGSGYVRDKPFDYTIALVYPGNAGDCGWREDGLNGKRLSELRPNRILLIEQQANQGWAAQDSPVAGLVWNCFSLGSGELPYVPGFHHSNGANILFPDGRVEWHARRDYQPGWPGGDLSMPGFLSQ